VGYRNVGGEKGLPSLREEKRQEGADVGGNGNNKNKSGQEINLKKVEKKKQKWTTSGGSWGGGLLQTMGRIENHTKYRAHQLAG